MKEKDKLKEKLKKEFETPEIPFDEWAKDNGVFTDVSATSPVTCPVYELADNVNGSGISRTNKKKIFIGSIVAVFVAVAIVLGVVLPRTNKTPGGLKLFGANDATTVKITLEEVKTQEDIYLFDMSAVVRMDEINKDVLLQDNSQILLYSLKNCLLSVENDAFYLTYRIRLYQNYEFYNITDYSALGKTIETNDFEVKYEIVDCVAYARFSDNDIEYFIEACGFEDVTTLTEDNFLNLLNVILV